MANVFVALRSRRCAALKDRLLVCTDSLKLIAAVDDSPLWAAERFSRRNVKRDVIVVVPAAHGSSGSVGLHAGEIDVIGS